MMWGAIRVERGRVHAPPGMAADDAPQVADVAAWWHTEGAGGVHVIDVDAARNVRPAWTGIDAARRAGLPVRYSGGLRSMTQVQQVLQVGGQAVVGTQAVLHPEWVRELCILFPGGVVVAVDARGREVLVDARRTPARGDVDAVAANLTGLGLSGVVCRPVDGALDADVVRSLADVAPVTAQADADAQWDACHAAGAVDRLVGA